MSDNHEENLESLFAEYVDRLNAGEKLDADTVLAENPRLGEELLEYLEKYLDAASSGSENEPLGVLGDYTLRRQIGRGGMGVVYEAWENSMDRRVALKVLPVGIAADDKAVTRFVREAQLAGKLNHPSVVGVYGMGVKEQTPYYAMEFVEGETLAQVLAKLKAADPEEETPFGKKDSVVYFGKLSDAFADVADGLQHAHSKGIIHRDIKPSNLILDREGRLRILDFGLARLEGQDSLTISGDVVGTPLYMSPEQARRKKIPIDHRTDVYSLGATLYEMLTLHPPFSGSDHNDTLSQIIERDPVEPRKVNPRVPKDLETIVLKCLQKDAGDRYGTAEAMGQDLWRFVRGDAIEARAEGKLEKLGRWIRRRRGKLAFAVILFLLLSMLGWALVKQRNDVIRKLDANYRAVVLDAAVKLEGASLMQGWPTAGGVSFSSHEEGGLKSVEVIPTVENLVAELAVAISLLPSRPDARYHRARALLILGRDEDALSEIEAILARNPSFVPAFFLKSSLIERRGGIEKASKLKAAARAVARDDVSKAWVQAEAAASGGRWRDAIEAYGRWIVADSQGQELYVGASAAARLRRGAALLEVKDYFSALKDFIVAQVLLPGAVEPVLFEGKTYCLLERSVEAEAAFQSLLDKSVSIDEIALGVAGIYDCLGDYQKSLDWSGRVGAEHLRECSRAWAFHNLGRLRDAAAASERAVEVAPDNGFIAGTHSFMLYARGEYEEGIRFTEEAVRRIHGPLAPYMYLASNLYAAGRFEEAVRAQRRALELRPGNARIMTVLGLFLGYTGRFDEAFACYESSIAQAPQFAMPHLHRAHTLALQGRYAEAIRDLDMAIEKEPKWSWPWRFKGALLDAEGKSSESLAAYEAAMEGSPKEPRIRVEIGWMLERLSRHAEAVPIYLEALQSQTSHVETNRRVIALLRAEESVFSQSELDRFEEAEEVDLAGGTGHPLSTITLALALTASPSEAKTHNAIVWLLRGIDAAENKAPECVSILSDALIDVFKKAPATATSAWGLLPRLPAYGALERLLDKGLELSQNDESAILGAFENSGDLAAANRLDYLKALLQERTGAYLEAAARFEIIAGHDPKRPEPLLALARSLRAAGRSREAEVALRKDLANSREDDPSVWNAWAALSIVDLAQAPAVILSAFPGPLASNVKEDSIRARNPRDDIRWLLTRLQRQEPLRINCGGGDCVAPDGRAWSRDRFYLSGKPDARFTNVRGAHFETIYETYRRFPWDQAGRAAYVFPLPVGRYQVSLYFAETFFQVAGRRRFDVTIQGQQAIGAFDPAADGYARAIVKRFEAIVNEGLLEIRFHHRPEDDPIISGIEIERVK